MIYILNDLQQGDSEVEFSNALYDETVRREFIEQINLLIPRISDLDDFGIRYECLRISAILQDAHSGVGTSMGDTLPICFESIGKESDFLYCTVRTPEDKAHLIGSRLVSVNSIPIVEIASRFTLYIPHENTYWLAHRIASPFDYSYLTQKPALQAIGVVDPTAESVEIQFETDTGMLVETVHFVSTVEYENMELVTHDMVSAQALKFLREDKFWYAVMKDGEIPYIYVRLSSMADELNTFYRFYTAVTTELKNSDVPLKLVIDIRDNSGGVYNFGTLTSFTNAVNRYQTNGTYILINGGCFSAGMMTPYTLAGLIDGAMLVGSPTGQFGNCFGEYVTYRTPNNGMWFYVADNYKRFIPDQNKDAIYPDVKIYQTWEDYQNNIDTVLDYVLSLS